MNVEELDKWGESLRDLVKAKVEETGYMAVGAQVIITKDMVTGADLPEPRALPLTSLSDENSVDRAIQLLKTAREVVKRCGGVAVVIYSEALREEGGKPNVVVAFQRIRMDKARVWFGERESMGSKVVAPWVEEEQVLHMLGYAN